VWQTGEVGRKVSRSNPIWLAEYGELLPNLKEEGICGSGFAITDYELSSSLGEPSDLIRLGDR